MTGSTTENLSVVFSSTFYGLCLKYMRNEDDAKDVFQEAFVIAFQNGTIQI